MIEEHLTIHELGGFCQFLICRLTPYPQSSYHGFSTHLKPPNSNTYRPYLDQGRQGFIYLLTNVSMPGLVKIGATRKHPIQRAKELGATTGVPGEFTLAYYRDYLDCFLAETLTHQVFDRFRVNESREFFRVSVGDVVAHLDSLPMSSQYREKLVSGGIIGGLWGEGCEVDSPPRKPFTPVVTPMAELFASFPDDGSPRELTQEERARCAPLSWWKS